MSLVAGIRKRYAPLLLLAAAGGAALFSVPKIPHDHAVTLRLPDAATVTGVEIAWSTLPAGADAAGSEAVQGGSWRFASGSAPATLDTHVHLPDGRYALEVAVDRAGEWSGFRRVIVLGDADHIVVPLH